MPSYRERREAGEFAVTATKYDKDKPALEAVQEAAEEEGVAEEEGAAEEPAPRPKRSGVKVSSDE